MKPIGSGRRIVLHLAGTGLRAGRATRMQGSVYCHNTHIRMSGIPREATGRRDSRMLILTGKGATVSLDATLWVKGVSSTLILGGVEKKITQIAGNCHRVFGLLAQSAQRVEYCWELPFRSAGLWWNYSGHWSCVGQHSSPSLCAGLSLPVPVRCPHKQCIAILCLRKPAYGMD